MGNSMVTIAEAGYGGNSASPFSAAFELGPNTAGFLAVAVAMAIMIAGIVMFASKPIKEFIEAWLEELIRITPRWEKGKREVEAWATTAGNNFEFAQYKETIRATEQLPLLARVEEKRDLLRKGLKRDFREWLEAFRLESRNTDEEKKKKNYWE